MKNSFALSIRYMKKNRLRTLITIIGVMLSTILIYCIATVFCNIRQTEKERNYGLEGSWDMILPLNGDNKEKYISVDDNGDISFKKISYSDCAIDRSWILTKDEYAVYVNDYDAMVSPPFLINGRFPANDREIVVRRDAALNADIKQDKLTIASEENTGDVFPDVKSFFVSGISKEPDFEGLSILQNNYPSDIYMLFASPYYSKLTYDKWIEAEKMYCFISFTDKNGIESKATKLAEKLGITDFIISQESVELYDIPLFNAKELALMLIFLYIFGIVIIILVRNAFNLSVNDREHDYGLLRCIGLTRRQIIKLIINEGVLTGACGIILGIVVGHLILSSVNSMVLRTSYSALARVFGLPNGEIKVRVFSMAVLTTIVYMFIVTLYSMISPIEILYKLNPIDAIKNKNNESNKNCIPEGKKESTFAGLMKERGSFEALYARCGMRRRKNGYISQIAVLSLGVMLITGAANMFNSVKVTEIETSFPYDGSVTVHSYDKLDELEKALYKGKYAESYDVVQTTRVTINEGQDDFRSMIIMGWSKDKYELIEKKANMISKDVTAGVVNVIWISDTDEHGLYEEVKVGMKLNSVYDENVILYVCGIVSIDDYNDVFRNMDDFKVGKNGTSRFIYSLDDNERVFEMKDRYYDPKSNRTESSGCDIFIKLNRSGAIEEFYRVINEKEYDYHMYANDSGKIEFVKLLFYGLITLVMTMIVLNSINIRSAAYEQRRGEFRLLKQLGACRKQLQKILIFEGVRIYIYSSIVGCILGLVLSYVATWVLYATGGAIGGFNEDMFSFRPDVFAMLIVTFLVTITGFMVTFISTRVLKDKELREYE